MKYLVTVALLSGTTLVSCATSPSAATQDVVWRATPRGAAVLVEPTDTVGLQEAAAREASEPVATWRASPRGPRHVTAR